METGQHDDFKDVLLEHLPAAARPFAHKLEKVPLAYRMAAVAANLSSNMVYSEGCRCANDPTKRAHRKRR